ncbi:Imm15 family immunity protein [Pseudomonas sp. lyk4-TYG-107]|uniref:Imm15 family immunity protein n=1 Tax=Pseudomonas sp. lyk4-TYG-107 TaxID=3040317 RepID=UPI002555D8E3|nr:Imm15 family immunity protein [Pseudomonas sp. lyk4-TYG-107]
MKLVDIYTKIINKEPYSDMGVFFEDYENFEEIPLVSRYKRLDFLKKEMSNDKVSEVLVGMAVFVMSLIRIMEKIDKGTFYAITFTDFDDVDERSVIIPNIFVYPEGVSSGFLDKVEKKDRKVASREMEEVKNSFRNVGGESMFDFHESRFYDSACDEEIVRVFVVPKVEKRMVGKVAHNSRRPSLGL